VTPAFGGQKRLPVNALMTAQQLPDNALSLGMAAKGTVFSDRSGAAKRALGAASGRAGVSGREGAARRLGHFQRAAAGGLG
jgi:hypothetical protein